MWLDRLCHSEISVRLFSPVALWTHMLKRNRIWQLINPSKLRCLAWTLARNTRVGANRRKNTPGCGLPLLRSLRWPLDVVFIGFYDLSEDLHFPLEVLSFFFVSSLHSLALTFFMVAAAFYYTSAAIGAAN